jgi:uridine kinase
MKLIVLKSSYNIGRHINNKLINNKPNKCTILCGFMWFKNEAFESMSEYLGGDG